MLRNGASAGEKEMGTGPIYAVLPNLWLNKFGPTGLIFQLHMLLYAKKYFIL